MSTQKNLLRQILLAAVDSGELLAIYNQIDNLDTFWVGKVIKFDELADTVLFAAYNDIGLRSGWRVLPFEQIWQINRYDDYVKALQTSITLIDKGALNGLIQMPHPHLPPLLALKSLTLPAILQLCQQQQWFTGMTLNFSSDPEIYGYLKAVSHDSFVLAAYSLLGELEGEQTLFIKDIQSLVWQNYQSLVRERLVAARKQSVV